MILNRSWSWKHFCQHTFSEDGYSVFYSWFKRTEGNLCAEYWYCFCRLPYYHDLSVCRNRKLQAKPKPCSGSGRQQNTRENLQYSDISVLNQQIDTIEYNKKCGPVIRPARSACFWYFLPRKSYDPPPEHREIQYADPEKKCGSSNVNRDKNRILHRIPLDCFFFINPAPFYLIGVYPSSGQYYTIRMRE